VTRKVSINEFKFEKSLTVVFEHFLNLQNRESEPSRAVLQQLLEILKSKFFSSTSKQAPQKVFNGTLGERGTTLGSLKRQLEEAHKEKTSKVIAAVKRGGLSRAELAAANRAM